MPKLSSWERKHRANMSGYQRQIDALYNDVIKEASLLAASVPNFKADSLFQFTDYPTLRKRVERLFSAMNSQMYGIIVNGIEAEWTLANNKNSELARQVFGDNIGKLSQAQYRRYFSTNDAAREAFIARKEAGLKLSDRVWRYTGQFKEEIELGIDVGLRGGQSAADMARDLKQYLREPDRLFRRVRDEHGELQLSRAAQAYHPGQGVYRSSYKNARRLAATETNIAYRTSDYERWQQLDFVVGIEIQLSNNHPEPDICDDLAGRYPKDFKFTGWHPHCRCHAVSILKTEEEVKADTQKILNGEPLDGDSVNRVDDVPQVFKDWLTENQERLEGANSIPYFLSDNPRYTGVQATKHGFGSYTGTKLGRTATKEAYKVYKDAPVTVLSEQQRENIADIAKALGVEAKPMTFFEADNGSGNVDFKRDTLTADNCQTCVLVHEARLRGLPITAKPYTTELQIHLGDDSGYGWMNPKTGKSPQVKPFTGRTPEELYKTLENNTQSVGRYHIGMNFKDNSGHIITAERFKSGEIFFYDPQDDTFLNIKEFTEVVSFEVLKVDKLLLRKDVITAISRLL